MSVFDALQGDIYRPSQLKESLAQYDNYQIYTLVCVDRKYTISTTEYYESSHRGLATTFDYTTHLIALVPYSPARTTTDETKNQKDNWLAIQSFAPVPIPVNFLDYVEQYHGQ
jgi:hypothetical protein